VDMRSMMSLFMSGLCRLLSKEGNEAMLIGDMDISRLMIHVQQVGEDKPKDREEFCSKRAKTSNQDSDKLMTENVKQFSFLKRSPGPSSSSDSVNAPNNGGDLRNHISQNLSVRPTLFQGSVAQEAN